MRISLIRGITAAIAGAVLLLTAGCDGGGLNFAKEAAPPVGDQPPGADPSDPGDFDPPPVDNPFHGRWLTAYGDDRAGAATRFGANQYAVRLDLRQSGNQLSGEGRMFRVFREGPTATDEVTFAISGQASDHDATITLEPSDQNAFQFTPRWYLRLTGNRMVGMHVEQDGDGSVARSGHAEWVKELSGTPERAFVTAYHDRFSASGVEARNRVGNVNVNADAAGNLSGSGSFVEQRRDQLPLELDYNITRGRIAENKLGMTFGGEDLSGIDIDWYGFYSADGVVAAYAQFDPEDALIRYGNALWRRSPDPNPNDLNRTWVTAFTDWNTRNGAPKRSYVAVVSLQVGDGGEVTGSARLLDQSADEPEYRTYDVREGNVLGSKAYFELSASSETILWDLRLGSSLMVGAYQRVDGQDRVIGQGVAEWRPQSSSPSVRGAWGASYVDGHGAASPETTQLAAASIANEEDDGAMSGSGYLRFAGEDRRRLFNISGETDSRDIEWRWAGGDLFGETVWNLQQAGSRLFGAYTNYDSEGNVETTGSGVWHRSSQSAATFSE